MEQPFEVGAARYQSENDYVYASDAQLRFDQRRLASLVGYVAIGLPIVLALGGIFLDRVDLGEFRSSLSAFYYERVILGDVFVGCLVFIGTIMFAYRGWSRKVADLATIAGLSAYMVALFPCAGWLMGESNAPIFVKVTEALHGLSALVLFCILAFFCFFVFTKVEAHQTDPDGTLAAAKRKRDRLYRISGTLILLSIAGVGVSNALPEATSVDYRITYWAETVMLIAFGVSWLVQGRVSGTALLDSRDKSDIAKVEAREAISKAD